MEFFNSAIDVLQTLVVALGGGLCVWGGINLLEGYGQDNPGSPAVRPAGLMFPAKSPRGLPPLAGGRGKGGAFS